MNTKRLKEAIAKGSREFLDCISYELIFGDPHEYYSILHYAIKIEAKKHNDLRQIVLHLIKCGIDVHFKLKGKISLLVHALKCGSSHEVITELIKKGSDVNVVSEEGYTPLFYALQMNSDKKIIFELISNGADVNHRDIFGRTPLFSVINNPDRFKDPEIIKMFVKAGAMVNERYHDGRNILMLDLCKCMLNDIANKCILKEFVHTCIKEGVNLRDIDNDGNNIFHHSNCTYLLDLAAKFGVSFEEMNNLGQTALMQAAVKSDVNRITYFLSRGANVNCVDFDLNTPLHFIFSSKKLIRNCALNTILYHGADLFASNLMNVTPLDIFFRNDGYLFLRLEYVIKHILLFDENKLKTTEDTFKSLYADLFEIMRFDKLISDFRKELDKMKSKYITNDLTFYEFCIRREFYQNKYIDISVDEYKYKYEKIKKLFPIYEDLIIIRMKDNMRKKGVIVLQRCFEQITKIKTKFGI